MMALHSFRILSLLFLVNSVIVLSAQTLVSKEGDSWQLLVDGTPFDIKGVTFGFDEEVEAYDSLCQELQFLGVNTIRTWGTGPYTNQLLDAAHKHHIKVMLGIWMRHGRPGMEGDDRFDYLGDQAGKNAMFTQAMDIVSTYKDHPAVLTWGVGNEVYLNTETDEEKVAYSQLLERICSSIKEVDPNHPVTSVEAWMFGVDWWQEYVPSIDIYGINTYGAGANFISKEFADNGVDKPFMISEFGVRGEWEIEPDHNGVKPEPGDEEKYQTIVNGYTQWIQPNPGCLGVYVFHFSSDTRFVAPWLLTHFNGKTRPQYWAIREAYTGKKPLNHVPAIHSFQLPKEKTKSGTWVPAELECSDEEGEELEVQFFYNQWSGSRKRRDQLVPLSARGSWEEGYDIQLPTEDGGIKIYAMVSDSYNNVGIATTSISVIDKEAAQRIYQVPQVSLPFYVYKDHGALPYVFSAYMGNYEDMEVDLAHRGDVNSGETCIKIRYNDTENWYGIGCVDPAGDWGDILGGYNITGAKSFSFWAKAGYDGLPVTVGFGLIEGEKPFPDSEKKLIEIVLTDQWEQYTIKTKKLDLSCIRSGFVIFSSGEGLTHEIYIDDIVFE